MNLRSGARVFITVSVSISGIVETLSATGPVVELSPNNLLGPGVHTLAVSGPLQMLGAVLVACGRKTRWTLGILGCYVFLVSVFGDLPLIFHPDVSGNAIVGLLSNLAVMGGLLCWLRGERILSAHRAELALPMANSATAWSAALQFCPDSSGPQTPAPGQVSHHIAALARR
jgi:hypothetical protein